MGLIDPHPLLIETVQYPSLIVDIMWILDIKVYKDILCIFFTHLYVKDKLHSQTISFFYIHTETYIYDICFGTDYKILWSVNPFFVYLVIDN